jgi:hypothetical protein
MEKVPVDGKEREKLLEAFTRIKNEDYCRDTDKQCNQNYC